MADELTLRTISRDSRDALRPSAVPRCRITLLGRLTLGQDGRTLTHFRTQRTAALLAFLAYHCRQRHPRTILIDLLWRNAPLSCGRHSLSTAISFLRLELAALGVMPGRVILADHFSVGLNPAAISTDVLDFECAVAAAHSAATRRDRVRHLRSAVELYSGDLLPGFGEEWVPGESQRLRDKFINVVAQMTALLAEDEDHASVIPLARRAIQADPLREEPYRQLMQAYRAMGEPEAALGTYEELATALRHEVNGQPCQRTQRMARQLTAAA